MLNKHGKKVMEISLDTAGKISGKLLDRLENEYGIEVVVIEEEKAPTITDLAEKMTLELVNHAVKLEEVFDENFDNKVKHRVPKKIGSPCKAKYNKIRGKRYGR